MKMEPFRALLRHEDVMFASPSGSALSFGALFC